MPSIHLSRWIDNLTDSGYELFWFDVTNRGRLQNLDSVSQFLDWDKRKLPYLTGEYFLSKRLPRLYEAIRPILEVTENEALEEIIKEIQPDVVHSFELQSCSYPIVKTMQKYSNIKWIYSCWGSDLFYYKNLKAHTLKINQVLNRINYLHTDCDRDYRISKDSGFKGIHLGVIPGGGGYKLNEYEKFKLSNKDRKIILVKGYEHFFGRGLNIVKALQILEKDLKEYKIIVFGAHQSVIDYIQENKLSFKFYHRHELSHKALMKIMGQSSIYIGNSISDGMPNTLLEAILMGSFPIQSNPGNVSEEIITDGVNGKLINNPENIIEIKNIVLEVIKNKELIATAQNINSFISKDKLDFNINKDKIISLYKLVQPK
jgi:hypothetical protein